MSRAFDRRAVAALIGLASSPLFMLDSGSALAAIESLTVTEPSCDVGASVARNCSDTGYLNTSAVGATSQFIGSPAVGGSIATFTSAFDAWDAANGDKWTLVNGGVLSLTVNVNIGVGADQQTGGLSWVVFSLGTTADTALLPPGSSVTATSPNGAKTTVPLSKLVWTQALVVNYSPLQGPLAQPIETLDTFSLSQDAADDNKSFPKTCAPASSGAGTFCGPIYPFQYGTEYSSDDYDEVINEVVSPSSSYYKRDKQYTIPLGVDFFYDAPQGAWPDASFEAVTLLSEVTGPDQLTVYQGISYGFSLDPSAVPEPATWAMALVGFASVGLAGCRARRRLAATAWQSVGSIGLAGRALFTASQGPVAAVSPPAAIPSFHTIVQ